VAGLVRIPRHLLHVEFDDLTGLGVPRAAQDALRGLLADLPLVPDASMSAQLIGPDDVALACLAVLARHVGQGLRDHNLSMAHDRARLRSERQKLVFLESAMLLAAVANGDERPRHEAVLFALNATPSLAALLAAREAAGLATFVTSRTPQPALLHWRIVNLSAAVTRGGGTLRCV
jgi:hypothetical protein